MADEYGRQLCRVAVAELAEHAGFGRVSGNGFDLLVDFALRCKFCFVRL